MSAAVRLVAPSSSDLPDPREGKALLERRWRGPEMRVAVRPDQIGALRGRRTLYLGESVELGTLLAMLPEGYTPMTDPEDMLSELVPEHPGCDCLSDVMLAADEDLYTFGLPTWGLFWRGCVSMERAALVHSLAAIRGHRRGAVVTAGPLSQRAGMAPARTEIRVDGLGRVGLSRPTEGLGWTHDGELFAASDGSWRSALADYHLWWAWRLHSYAKDVSKSRWDLHLARLAARRGLAQIRALGADVNHLDAHLGESAQRGGL